MTYIRKVIGVIPPCPCPNGDGSESSTEQVSEAVAQATHSLQRELTNLGEGNTRKFGSKLKRKVIGKTYDGPKGSDTPPKMDADTPVVGTENAFARGDHQHPHDTTKADVTALVTERKRAMDAETALGNRITTNGNAINAEKQRAQQKEQLLQQNITTESQRAQEAEQQLRALYQALTETETIPVSELPATGEAGKIYRLAGTNSYADYMYNENDLTTPIKMAEYDNAIDDEPTAGSDNLVKSGGVANSIIPLAMSSLCFQKGDVKIICNEPGYYSNGTLYGVAGGIYVHSGLVKATPGKYKLTAYGSSTIDKIGFYNENKEYVNRLSNDANQFEITIPDNVSYIRFSTSVADGGYVIVSSAELDIDSKIREHNLFDYAKVEKGVAINNTGEITESYEGCRLVRLYLQAGKYWIVSPGSGTLQTLWKYTNSTYSKIDAIQIIGTSDSFSKVVELDAGYYAFCWYHAGDVAGIATITNAWVVGQFIDKLNTSEWDDIPKIDSNKLVSSNGIAKSNISFALLSITDGEKSVNIPCSKKGYYSNGVLYGATGNDYVHSDLIEAVSGRYTLTSIGSATVDKIGFYNANGDYIGRATNDASTFTIDIPTTAKFMRFSVSTENGGVVTIQQCLSPTDLIRERNIFKYSDILIGKAIKDTGEIWNVSVVYKLVKLYLEAGKYWIVSPGNGSQQTLWKYTDDTYSQTGAIQIIGHIDDDTPVSDVVDLEAGYYAFSWVDMNYSGITEGAASITKAWAIGETLKRIKESASGNIDIVLPDKIYSVVGDTLQLFYQGIIKAVNPENYDILVTCAKGKQYPRYFEFTPIASDIGTTTLTIAVKDNNGNILSSKSCNLITHAAPSSPASQVNVVCFGDSLTRYGVWCKEVQRRLTGSGGTPAGANISNINLVGRMQEDGAGWFGVGGWSWNSYISNMVGYKFYVSGVTTVHVGDYYSNNGETFRIIEVNITNGSGYISGAAAGSGTPSASGTLVFVEGSSDGDRTITFSSSEVDPANPFWDSANNKISFVPYANAYANGKIDVIVSFLSWNGVSNKGYESFESIIKQLADVFHQEFPNGKWKLCGIPMPSINGGTGANYGATGSRTYADRYYLIGAVLEINKMYQRICNEAGYSDFMEFVDVSAEFDALYNMPNAQKAVNIRNSSFTELVGTNGVHPATAGYLQIADTIYRNIVSNYC